MFTFQLNVYTVEISLQQLIVIIEWLQLNIRGFLMWFKLIMTIIWFLFTVVGDNKIDDDKKCKESAGDFDHHADAAVQCRAHCLMEHIPGFTRSHWMPPLGKCLQHIAPEAAMVDEYVENTQKTNKKLFLASNYGTN